MPKIVSDVGGDEHPSSTDKSVVQVIDLDAAMGRGDNQQLVKGLCAELPCQVGGGLRTTDAARQVFEWGAKKAIIGSSLFLRDDVNIPFAKDLADQFGEDRLIFAVDSRGGFVAVKGWKESTGLQPSDAMRKLEPFCSTFLYTHIDTEGLLQGFPFSVLDDLRNATRNKLIVAGGIKSAEEIARLHEIGIDAVVGMAIYTGVLQA